jgi:hypothetical protein
MTPALLDLVPEQHPVLFPRKRKLDKKTGAMRLVNTSKTTWATTFDGRRAERTFVRDLKSVIGVTIHQTACVFGPLDDPPKRHRRALGVPAHVVAFRDGVYAQTAPLSWYLYHGNDLSARTLGLECEGHFPGLLDDPTTPRREDEDSIWSGADATPLLPAHIACFRAALRHLVENGRALGMPIEFIWAHRQANKDRRSDPGQGVWVEVAEFGVRELGLTARYADVFDDGKPVPREWAPGGVGGY